MLKWVKIVNGMKQKEMKRVTNQILEDYGAPD